MRKTSTIIMSLYNINTFVIHTRTVYIDMFVRCRNAIAYTLIFFYKESIYWIMLRLNDTTHITERARVQSCKRAKRRERL